MDEHQSNRVQAESQSKPTETFSSSSSTPARIPKSIGRYRIKRILATGGMGTVYEALQEQPRRTVAVKVMKHGVASRSAMRRFEYESQLLARLRHPGIAQIYEAGTHDDGTGPVPFFAMEYIGSAKPITQYANDKHLDTRARLELFMRVCAAAHHGHQKGIIHRDLKPGNILVDSNGDVKIIDFGVARGTDSDLAVTTLQTDVGQLIGTLQYMSPEQCDADPNDIDTRSDVYSMGVVLYELLAGRPPYQVTKAKIYEGTRAIREEQPTSLSTVDSTLKGDIETIVLKALQKDRDRRYQSAAEMGADIQRYLNGEAIVARPPSMAYQLRVFARRNKPVAAALAVIILALSAGLFAVSVAYVRIQNAQAEAQREQQLRMQAEQFAEQSRIEMERHRANAVAMLPLKDRIGQPAPVFDAATLEGKPLGGDSFKEYPATVLNFVAANCPYSTRKITELCGIRKAYGDAGVRFVNIAQTMKRKVYNAADSLAMFTGEGQDWELVYDPGGAIGDRFNIRGFPKLVVVDNNGKIVEAGTFKGSYLADSLDKILANNSNIDLKKIRKAAESPVNTDLAALEELWRRRLEVHRRVTGVGAEAYYQLAKLLRAQGKYTEAEDMYRQAAKSYAEVIGTDHSLVRSAVAGLEDLLESQNRQLDSEALIKDLLAKKESDDTKNPADPAQP